jgi:oligopeptide transport system substrate-binding protein
MRHRLTAVPLLILLAFLTLVRVPAAASQDMDGKVLRIQWSYFPDTLDPQQTDIGQATMSYLAFEGLTRLDEELNTVPAAAESWQFNEDGTVLTFHLRDGLVYSDGTPLTAERFRYAIERECDPHNDFYDAGSLFVITGCEALNSSLGDPASPATDDSAYASAKANLGVRALDERTLEIHLARPAPYFPSVAGGAGFLPVKQELVEAGGPEWWLDPANWVGNGPFRVTAIERGGAIPHISFSRNEHYWGGPAKLDGIEYRIIESADAVLDAYRGGDLDIIWAPTGAMSMAELENDLVLSRELLSAPVSFVGVFLLNMNREPFNDKKMREAFAYAFDRESYCRELEAGTCTATLSWIPPGVPGAIETDAYAFDPEKARRALTASSYGGPENVPDILWYAYPQDDPWYARRDDWLIDQFRDVLGVEMILTIVTEEEYDSLFDAEPAAYPQIGSSFWYSSLPDPHDWMSFWTCGSEYFAVSIGYCNPEYDALVAGANSELDPDKRLDLARESQRVLVADAPSIFAYNPTNVWLVKPYVVGYSPTAPNQHWPGWWTPLAVDIAMQR